MQTIFVLRFVMRSSPALPSEHCTKSSAFLMGYESLKKRRTNSSTFFFTVTTQSKKLVSSKKTTTNAWEFGTNSFRLDYHFSFPYRFGELVIVDISVLPYASRFVTRHKHARVGVLLFFLISFDCRCKAIRRDNRRYLIEFSA